MDYHSIFLFQGLTEADIDQMERSRLPAAENLCPPPDHLLHRRHRA